MVTIKIVIIDYQMGNIRSVFNATKHLGADPFIANRPSEVRGDKVIIPGVGAFGEGMRNFRRFIPVISEALASHLPVLGICLGLQMFFERSEEAQGQSGLGLMKGQNVKIRTKMHLPHIGWNSLQITKPECPLFSGVRDGYVYFIHSYHAVPDEDVVVATSDYGDTITASVWKNTLYGTQFHPEKSGSIGLQILKNFLEL